VRSHSCGKCSISRPTSWLDRREREAVAYLIEENRLLRRQLGRRRLHLTDADRRRLAARAYEWAVRPSGDRGFVLR
jgi:hypothetical protein